MSAETPGYRTATITASTPAMTCHRYFMRHSSLGAAGLSSDPACTRYYRVLHFSPLAWTFRPPAPQQYRVQDTGGVYVFVNRLRYSG